MEILIYGIGGVGGYFGGKLSKAGYEVSMIARGKHLEAIKENGLEVESINGNFTVKPKLATDDVAEVPTPDLVILGVKSWQISEAAEAIKPIIGKNTMVLPLQNGASNAEKLMEVIPKENVLGGLCRIIAFKEGPGKIKHPSIEPHVTFGELNNSKTERILQLKEIFDSSGVNCEIPEDIQLEIWRKFLYITTVSAIGGLTRVSIDKILKSDYLKDMMRKTAEEVLAVANKKGIALTQEHVEKALKVAEQQPKGTTASTQRDIMNGKPSELENFNGYIVKEGEKWQISTPVNRLLYELVLPMEKEARKA
ncbi:ketopantoate reductase family protein [Autumnicola edwardsiae]|uniref:2-dehydropantoate 2-reductase n=1 Tax=Autumnicola edwardsiae TaxID=3075594 RepID=A0ABU3CS95_9FLAO|nr:2-dehydropantoate 2-reductase [Zunongwangia sp. F297]MDT0649229.1 2-dehydropantoate 2-reductase [Zunongwangia sp. F297]